MEHRGFITSEEFDGHTDLCMVCGVTIGFGHCHECLLVAVENLECEDRLDEL